MKKHLLLIVSAAAVLAAGCTREMNDPKGDMPAGGLVSTVSATMPATKATFENDQVLQWQEDDVIGLYVYSTTKDNSNPAEYTPWIAPYTLSSGAGTGSAKFSHVFQDESLGETYGNVAIYPYNDASAYHYDEQGGTLDFNLPYTYRIDDLSQLDKVNIPMAAALDMSETGDKGTFTFKHLGGAIKVTMSNLPADTDFIELQLPDKRVRGLFTDIPVAELGNVAIEAPDTDKWSECFVRFSFDQNLQLPDPLTLYFPVPVGTYETIQVAVYDHDACWVCDKVSHNPNTVNRGTILQMPAFAFPDIVYPDNWSVIGTINDSNWDTDFDMTPAGPNVWTIEGVHATAEHNQFKIRSNHEWGDYEFGGSYSYETYNITAGESAALHRYGCNFCLFEEGWYNITFNLLTRVVGVEAGVEPQVEEPIWGGEDMVDLGLSVKWASCNLGAQTPDAWGTYVKWGETQPSSGYDWTDYKWTASGTSTDDIVFSKYTVTTEQANVYLDLADDAAHANLHDKWRMPTFSECYELANNTDWVLTSMNGQPGYKVTSKISGYEDKWIFLPIINADQITSYWTNELNNMTNYNVTSHRAYVFNIYEQTDPDHAGVGDGWRCTPYPVRPVYDPNLVENEGPQAIPLCRLSNGDILCMADRNVGAAAPSSFENSGPETYGDYFSWADTEGHAIDYQFWKYKWFGPNNQQDKLSKYCTYDAYWAGEGDTCDGLRNILPEDDAATVAFGAPWHIMTYEEVTALQDNCDWIWDSTANCAVICGRDEFDGNFVFLPAAGSSLDGASSVGRDAIYWVATNVKNDPFWAFILEINGLSGSKNYNGIYSIRRTNGCSIRPVVVVSSN